MSDQQLVDILEKLYMLHESLYKISLGKTDIIMKGDIESLQELLKDEHKHVTAINTLEKERQKVAKHFLNREDDSEVTISNCMEAATGDAKNQLVTLQANLSSIITYLQQQNELNQTLIYQSLQFVNMTLDMIQPRPDQATYGRPDKPKAQKPSLSMFDSKA